MANLPQLTPAPLATIEAENICIIKPSSLGDVVQALVVLHPLRVRFPRARIAWVVNRSLAPLLEPIDAIDEVIPFDRDALRGMRRRSIAGFAAFSRLLASKRFDLAIDLQGLFRSGAMVWATGADRRIGLASAREFSRWCYTDLANDLPKDRNAVDRYWSVPTLLGAGEADRKFPLAISAEEREWARHAVPFEAGTWIGVNPGARWETKRWPAERFALAVNRVWKGRDAAAVLLGAPDEAPIAAEVMRRLEIPAVNLCGKTNLRQLAAVLERVALLLTNDSGPMHLAAAVGTPTVSVFTCTSTARARPYGPGHVQIATNVWCAASYKRVCDRMDCWRDLPAERVADALATMPASHARADAKAA